jgi:hypothetical protein
MAPHQRLALRNLVVAAVLVVTSAIFTLGVVLFGLFFDNLVR